MFQRNFKRVAASIGVLIAGVGIAIAIVALGSKEHTAAIKKSDLSPPVPSKVIAGSGAQKRSIGNANVMSAKNVSPVIKDVEMRDRAMRAQALITNSPNSARAIVEARREFGEIDAVTYAENTIRAACSMDPDLMDSANPKLNDPTRTWAVSALLEKCQGIDKLSRSTAPISFDSPSAIAKTEGISAGISAAYEVIKTSSEFPELYDAGQVLLENGQLTSQNIPGLDRNLGATELLKSWTYASILWSCDQSGGCGPGNFQTDAFCANAGCAEGSTLWDGLHAAIPDREWQAVVAFYQWIENGQ